MLADDKAEPFSSQGLTPPVRGLLDRPGAANGDGLVVTHGAGSNCRAPVLAALAPVFAASGFLVLRCDLPYRQERSYGPPRPGDAARDREGLKNAVAEARKLASRRVFLGGVSYGGRQSTMLCAETPDLVDGLILFSYPLHPPGKPQQLRTQHFPKMSTPALFLQGTRDPFGSIAEMEAALELIPARHLLISVEGVGHDLGFKGKTANQDLLAVARDQFQQFFA
jgi:uncharacterized protein